MKINLKYILLMLFMFLPINVFAEFSLSCDKGPFNYQDKFNCSIIGEMLNYDLLTGSLDKSDYFSCKLNEVDAGLTLNSNDTKNDFNLNGNAKTSKLVTYECEVVKKSSNSLIGQIVMSNFNYHSANSGRDASNQVLRSGNIQINAYNENKIDNSDPRDKLRDTNNPNSRIKAIKDDNLKFTFSSFISEYNMQVLFEVSSLNLKIEKNVEGEVIQIKGNQNLEVGMNVIDIYATSPDGSSTTCYTLNIERLPRGQEIYYPENDSSLKELSIPGFNLNFEPQIVEYNIHLKYDQDNLAIKAVSNSSDATIEITNNEGISDGDTISVLVISQNGKSKTNYLIHVKKDAPPKNYSTLIYLALIIIAILFVIGLIVRTNKKNKNDPILSLNYKKKINNRGAKLDTNLVPNVNSNLNVKKDVINNSVESVINIQNANNIASPIQTNNVIDDNRNKTTFNVNTLNLSNNVVPIPVSVNNNPNNIINPNTVESVNNVQTLNLNNQVSQSQVVNNVNMPVLNQVYNPNNINNNQVNNNINNVQFNQVVPNVIDLNQNNNIVNANYNQVNNNSNNVNPQVNINMNNNINNSNNNGLATVVDINNSNNNI